MVKNRPQPAKALNDKIALVSEELEAVKSELTNTEKSLEDTKSTLEKEHQQALHVEATAKQKIAEIKLDLSHMQMSRDQARHEVAELQAVNFVQSVELEKVKMDLESSKKTQEDLSNILSAQKEQARVAKRDAEVRDKILENRKEQRELWKERTTMLYRLLVQEVESSRDGDSKAMGQIMAGLHEAFGRHLEEDE